MVRDYFWYWNEKSAAAATEDALVLLVGGFFGYMNFGDIAQLKSVIRLHRCRTGLNPIITCDFSAATDPDFSDQLCGWFDVNCVLFGSPIPRDAAALGLKAVRNPRPIPHLHVYGGGFMNHHWGTAHLQAIESLHKLFKVRHYQLSGQQISPSFLGELRRHFGEFPPRIAGGRDPMSTELIKRSGARAAYSFDDGVEYLQQLQRILSPSVKVSEEHSIHMNASSYVGDGNSEYLIDQLCEVLQTVVDRYRAEPLPQITAVVAYEDRRPNLLDTLEVIDAMGARFPFSEYRVLNLARLALEPDQHPDTLPRPLHPDARATATSYHVALLFGLAQVPCELCVYSDYYRQKKSGISSLKSVTDIPGSPALTHKDRLDARKRWLEIFVSGY